MELINLVKYLLYLFIILMSVYICATLLYYWIEARTLENQLLFKCYMQNVEGVQSELYLHTEVPSTELHIFYTIYFIKLHQVKMEIL